MVLTSAPIFPLAGSALWFRARACTYTLACTCTYTLASHTHARIKSLPFHFESPNRTCSTRAPLQLGNETSRACSLGAWPPTCDVAAITIVVHIITIVVITYTSPAHHCSSFNCRAPHICAALTRAKKQLSESSLALDSKGRKGWLTETHASSRKKRAGVSATNLTSFIVT